MELRRAILADAAELAATTHAGLLTYRAFAPEGWGPEPLEQQIAWMEDRLPRADIYVVLAEVDGEVAGHASFLAANASGVSDAGDHPPGLAHLWQLFVREPHWGSGTATALLEDVVTEAARQGFDEMRLFAARDQGRARAFYRREGFAEVGEPFYEPKLGLPLIQMRRALP